MATRPASLLVPGDKYHDLILRSLTKSGQLDVVTMRTLVVVRNLKILATETTPECVCIMSRDDDTGETVVNFYHPDESVTLVPKLSKWAKIWAELRK